MTRKCSGILNTFQKKAVDTTIKILEFNIFRDPITVGLAIKYLKDFKKKLDKQDR